MDIIQALILGVVEGFTEFLPVSSTGHLIIVSDWLGLEQNEQNKAFEIINNCLKQAEALENKPSIAGSLMVLGIIYSSKNDVDKAEEDWEEGEGATDIALSFTGEGKISHMQLDGCITPKQLKDAIDKEDYERAAKLRDQIAKLSGKTN